MTVLRIETTTIPAETIETIIIGVPAREWKILGIKEVALNASPLLCLIIWLFGIMIFGAGYWPDIVEQYQIDISSGYFSYVIVAVGFVIAIPPVILGTLLPSKARKLKESFLKKHGWDGESRYRVELR